MNDTKEGFEDIELTNPSSDDTNSNVVTIDINDSISVKRNSKKPFFHPSRLGYRILILLFASFMVLGSYFAYDSVNATSVKLTEELGYSNTQIGLLYSAYSLPNIILVFFGGILIDYIGTNKASILYSSFIVAGSFIVAVAPNVTLTTWSTFAIMIFGRFIFGVGSECLIISQSSILAKWFKSKELATSMAVALTFSRLGTFLTTFFLPAVAEFSYKLAFWISFIFCVLSFFCNLLLAYLDNTGNKILLTGNILIQEITEEDKLKIQYRLEMDDEDYDDGDIDVELGDELQEIKYELNDKESGSNSKESFNFKEILTFPISYYLIVSICVCFYCTFLPFQSFSVKFLTTKYGYSEHTAGIYASIISLSSLIASPIFGIAIDKKGYRVFILIGGCLAVIPSFLLLGITNIFPAIFIQVIGAAVALVPSAIWPMVPLIIKDHMVGTAFGLMTSFQNLGLFLVPFIVGALVDYFDSYAPMCIFFAILALIGLFLSVSLRFTRHYNLFQMNAKDANIYLEDLKKKKEVFNDNDLDVLEDHDDDDDDDNDQIDVDLEINDYNDNNDNDLDVLENNDKNIEMTNEFSIDDD